MKLITRLEEVLLIAIWRLKGDAYGVTINKQVSLLANRKYTMGALYFALDQLRSKGLVTKTVVSFPHERGGRTRTYYALTPKGEEALREVRAYQKSLWEGIPEMAFEKKTAK